MKRLADYFRIPEQIIDIWRREEGDSLLPLQVEAIENYDLLAGNSILITAPSSSGKTFVGEMAAVNSYYQGKKTILLVPMKAIAEEKYLDFQRKYQSYGLRIAISTHDRTEYDESILAGYFDIAVIIFEKMNVLLTQSAAVLNSCGLIIVDELQLLNDKTRGPDLEILLTKIKIIKKKTDQSFQFLGLSAVLANLNKFDEWLGAAHLATNTRPLELHEGVLFIDGSHKIKNFNDEKEYVETIPMINSIPVPQGVPRERRDGDMLEESIKRRLVVLSNHYLSLGKRILIFRKWRPLTVSTAQTISRTLNLSSAAQVIGALGELENSNSRETLIQCLSRGVAFHNSDLSPEERLAIELDFRNIDGQIKIICSTNTLAMGVNLPSSVVIIPDTMKPDQDSKLFHEIPISTSEYKNMSGRAGRTRYGEEGISVIMSNSNAEGTRYFLNYVKGKLDHLSSPLRNSDLRKIMLGLFASNLCKSQDEIQDFLISSYTGYTYWDQSEKSRRSFIDVIEKNCEFLKNYELLSRSTDGTICTTHLGKLCATSGTDVESFILLKNSLLNIDPTDWNYWEIVFPCLHCHEFADLLRIYIKLYDVGELWRIMDNINPKNYQILINWSLKHFGNDRDAVSRRVLSFLILSDWINGLEMRDLENKYTAARGNRVLSGTIRNIAETTSWMVQTLFGIGCILGYDKRFMEDINLLGEQLSRGVHKDGIPVHKLGVRGVTRTTIKKLVEAKISSLDKILDTPAEKFRGIISPSLAQRIHEAIVQKYKESQERIKYIQAHRLEKLGRDPNIIRSIFEKEGIPLEEAVVDLLNAPPLELKAERIVDQSKGEADIRMSTDRGIMVGSVTASRSNISDSKCAEIFRCGARENPSSYVVFGRPGFHDIAILNADHLNSQLETTKTYKLIPIQELGELFVRVAEGLMTKEIFLNIIMNDRGLIEASTYK